MWSIRWCRGALSAILVLALHAGALAQDGNGDAVRPALGRPLSAAQQLLKEQKFAEALDRLKEADAVGDKTGYESFVVEHMRGMAAAGVGDTATAATSFEAVLASGKLPPAERLPILQSMTAMFYKAKDYPKTVQWAKRYVQEGGTNAQIRAVLGQALYLSNDFAGAALELSAQVQAEEASGRKPTQEQLQLLASSYLRAKDDAGYATALEKLVTWYPSKESWADLVDRTQRKPGFSDKLALDGFRLQRATAGLHEAAEFMEMAQLSMEAGYPSEARAVLDDGYKAGTLGKGSDVARQNALRDKANQAAVADARLLAQQSAGTIKDSNGLATTGLALVFSGQADAGIAMMKEALSKGGLRQTEETRLRLGMACVMAGRKEEALATLKAVQGSNGASDLARLWALHARDTVQ